MAGERRLDRHVGRLQVADLAHHDDVRVLAHEGAHALGEAHVDAVLHLHLVEGGLDHLDRVLDRADVHLRRGELLERRVERRRLARARGSRDQDDAVGLAGHLRPAALVVVREAQLGEVAHQHFRVEDAHHQFFAEGGGQRRQAQLHLLAVGHARLDAPVLGAALLHHVHAAEDLDAAGHGVQHRHGDLVDLVQHPVDAEAHDAQLPPRLDMDVAGPLLEGVLPEPVDDADDVLVVGVELAVGPAQLHELLEIRQARRRLVPRLHRLLHRAGEVVELHQVAVDVERVGDDAADLLAQDGLQLRLPLAHVGLGGGDHHFPRGDLQRQDAEARRVGVGNHLGDGAEVDLQGVDVPVLEADAPGQPFREEIQGKRLVGLPRRLPFLVGNHHQGVDVASEVTALLLEGLADAPGDEVLRRQGVDHLGQGQAVLVHRARFCGFLHCAPATVGSEHYAQWPGRRQPGPPVFRLA